MQSERDGSMAKDSRVSGSKGGAKKMTRRRGRGRRANAPKSPQIDGVAVGVAVGAAVGSEVGWELGTYVGAAVGCVVHVEQLASLHPKPCVQRHDFVAHASSAQ